ncbi:hypothetical protein GCK32_002814 [Trichostrongylus colubriformis]|uniref:Uncharacterized protein n=1 Tax=Trichostrongylus colubriformis TaxID=6319 RepID=A0AAN8ESQ8_TRICO
MTQTYSDTLPKRAYHFSVSESMRHAYYIGVELELDGRQHNTLRVIDIFKATNLVYELSENLSSICMLYEAPNGVALVGAGDDSSITIFEAIIDHKSRKLTEKKNLLTINSGYNEPGTWSWNSTRSENGMTLMELDDENDILRIFDIRGTGEITACAEIEHYHSLGLAPYTQPWQDGTTISTFERLLTPFGRLAYTGRILNINIHTSEIEYTRAEGCPFEVHDGRELDTLITAPRLMKQIYRNGDGHAQREVKWRWQYVMELKANYRDITMDVNSNDTAIILIKTSNTDGMTMNVRIKSLIMLRFGYVFEPITLTLR